MILVRLDDIFGGWEINACRKTDQVLFKVNCMGIFQQEKALPYCQIQRLNLAWNAEDMTVIMFLIEVIEVMFIIEL